MLKHLVAFVTGGASGLGKATVQQLARKGSQVVFCDLPTSSGHAVAKELGDNVSFVPADITKEADVHAAIGHIDNKYGRLDVLVNCAGLANAFLAYNFHKDSPRNQQDFDTVLKTNVVGTLNVIRLAAALIGRDSMKDSKHRGVIINTAGIEGVEGVDAQVSTAAASAAIIAMTKPLAEDFRERGIRVVTVIPGLIDTPTMSVPHFLMNDIFNECAIAPNRVGHANEYAHLVQAIVANSSVNGTTIELSAGFRWCP